MLAETLSASIMGVEGLPVRVEVDVAFGLPALTIVGLAGSQVQEARERVRSALRNSGFEVPARRITINLSPADLPKDGTGYDLPIAVGILAASGQLRQVDRLRDTALVGELGLDGGVSDAEAMVLHALLERPGSIEELISRTDMPTGSLASTLTLLEARGLVESYGGATFHPTLSARRIGRPSGLDS